MEKNLSIERVINKYPYLKTRKIGFPEVGRKKNGKTFSRAVKNIADGFELYDSLMSTLNNDYSKEINLTSGNPMKYRPFKPAIKEIKQILCGTELNKYPYSEGDNKVRETLLKYIENEGFINNSPYDYDDIDDKGLSINNLTFTVSTSHAFELVLDVIVNDDDVILMTGPNYGLFSFKPERLNARVEIIDLDEEDNYLVNPHKLRNKIIDINKELKEEYGNREVVPKVVAFVNSNPCNPTGKVMGQNEYELLRSIGEICKDLGVFVIDDLVYRDLTYDRNNMAKPMATIPGMFRNTISLFGLSKAYGLAGLRAGFVVADEVIIREVINKIFQKLDAVPSVNGVALRGAYNVSKKRNREYKKYFDKLIGEYKFRFNLVNALINGIDHIEDNKERKKICKYIKKDKKALALSKTGVRGIKIPKKLYPESGFFVIIDFTELKGMKYNGKPIMTEEELLRFFYNEIKMRFLIGKSLLWPEDGKLIGRITFAKERKDIIHFCLKIKEAVDVLEK